MSTMTVVLNGEVTAVIAETTLAQVIAPLVTSPSGVAVALDDVVIPRRDWDATPLRDGARIEVLVAVQGG
jgi:sulfur carrier protein